MHKLTIPEIPSNYISTVDEIKMITNSEDYKIRWDYFRDTPAYKTLVDTLTKNQYCLCAYCEKKLSETNREIEHFMPKSLSSDREDYTFLFPNLLLCCRGEEENKTTSCGRHKGNQNPIIKGCMNPYTMQDVRLFKGHIAKVGILLMPDEKTCNECGISPDIVTSTIVLLNLNSNNLCKQRRRVWRRYFSIIEQLETFDELQRTQIIQKLQKEYNTIQEFITTIRWTIEEFIEK
jgi:uncharacterized protein (TIGR02646 family)